MILIEKDGTIASAAKDKEMKFWFPPENWKKEVAAPNPNPVVVEKTDVVLSSGSDEEDSVKKAKKEKKKSKKSKKKKSKKAKRDTSSHSESADDELEAPKPALATVEQTETLDKEDSSSEEAPVDPVEEEVLDEPVEEDAPVEEVNTEAVDDKKNVFANDSSSEEDV